MNVTENDFKFMVDCIERDVATLLVEKDKMTIHQALDALYLSDTYIKLHTPTTGLYFQSPVYVYSCLIQELKTGKLS